MTLLTAVNNIKIVSHRGDTTVTTDKDTANIVACLQVAWSDISTLLPRQAFRQDSNTNNTNLLTVQGQDIYSIPTNPYPPQEFIIFHYIFNNVNYNMKKIESEREFWGQVYYPQPPQTRPYTYVPYGFDSSGNKQIRMFPVPEQVYTIQYSFYIDPTVVAFSASNLSIEIPFLPSYLQESLWKGGLYYYYKSFDDPQQQVALVDYEKAKMRQDIAEDADQDSDLQFRFETNKTRFVDPITGIRLV